MKTKKIDIHIVGNWKMNPDNLESALSLIKEIKPLHKKLHSTKLRIAVPSIYVTSLVKQSGNAIEIGVQNIHQEKNGAHTGDISAVQAASVGACFTIVGHSERRSLGESDTLANEKILAALDAKLSVVLCVGETIRDSEGAYLSAIRKQITSAFLGVTQKNLSRITIAYEPVWAIGKNATGVATPVESLEVAILIRRTIADLYTETESKKIVILYGGSANSENASGFLHDGGIQGFLLGRASLDALEMGEIIKNF